MAMISDIRCNELKTEQRIDRLNSYFADHVQSINTFKCIHFDNCRGSREGHAFYEGQLPHVGSCYDLEICDRPLRIVVVGQEYGTGERLIGLSERSAMLTASAGSGFRKRNPHMKGTTSILRLLINDNIGDDTAGERLLGKHLFDCFALVNFLLCSALVGDRGVFDGGASKGASSKAMQLNCSTHFINSLKILEPTIVIVQGQGVKSWIERVVDIELQDRVSGSMFIGNDAVDVLVFDHPSAGGKSGYWGNSLRSRYLLEVVVPAIKRWRRDRSNFC